MILEIRNEEDRKVWVWHCENNAEMEKALEQAEDTVGDGWIEYGETNGELLVVLYDYDYYPE